MGFRGARASLPRQQAQPGVRPWDEFDQEPGGESAEGLGEVLHRLVSDEGEVMDQGQSHQHLRAASLEARAPLVIHPAGGRAGME
jgi:hypothetical protein